MVLQEVLLELRSWIVSRAFTEFPLESSLGFLQDFLLCLLPEYLQRIYSTNTSEIPSVNPPDVPSWNFSEVPTLNPPGVHFGNLRVFFS